MSDDSDEVDYQLAELPIAESRPVAEWHGLVGTELVTPWLLVDEPRHALFARSTELLRFYPSLDSESVVEGTYLLALLDPLLHTVLRDEVASPEALSYGWDRVRHTSPVSLGDRVRATFTLTDQPTRHPRGLLLRFDIELAANSSARTALVATWALLFPT